MGWLSDRRFLAALGIIYAPGLAVLVTSPWGWTLNRLTVGLYVIFRKDWPIAPAWVLPEHYGVLLNVVLFVPFGALIVALAGRPWWWVTVASLATSGVIELMQWRWLERQGAWSDVVANTAGGLLGAVALILLTRDRPGPGPRAAPARQS